jgi:DNA polymerase III alpha subunit
MYNNAADWTLEQKVEAHPLELVADQVSESGAIPTADAAGKLGRRVTVAGVRQTSHRSRTVKGEPMLFLTMEDLTGTLDVIAFPDVYRAAKDLLNSSSPLLVTGTMEMDASRGEPFLRAEKVVKLG